MGSNIGDRATALQRAVALLASKAGRIIAQSRQYETVPVGFDSPNNFINMAVCLETKLSPQALLRTTESIERDLGRTQKSQNGKHFDRTIDLDILYYDQKVYHYRGLIIPHPRLHERRFVLEPLCDIAPDMTHPLLLKNHRELLQMLGI